MSGITLVIANKKYSSWSLRAWLAAKLTGEKFEEVVIFMRRQDNSPRLLEHSPTGRLPVLHEGQVTIWESLAICEYLAERFPQAKLWPDDPVMRGHCRSSATEMQGGFAEMRQQLPMVVDRDVRVAMTAGTAANVQRIQAIWRAARDGFSAKAGGPFLYGAPTIADCMYAPAALRFRSYNVPMDATARAYVETVMGWAPMQEWIEAARGETEVLDY